MKKKFTPEEIERIKKRVEEADDSELTAEELDAIESRQAEEIRKIGEKVPENLNKGIEENWSAIRNRIAAQKDVTVSDATPASSVNRPWPAIAMVAALILSAFAIYQLGQDDPRGTYKGGEVSRCEVELYDRQGNLAVDDRGHYLIPGKASIALKMQCDGDGFVHVLARGQELNLVLSALNEGPDAEAIRFDVDLSTTLYVFVTGEPIPADELLPSEDLSSSIGSQKVLWSNSYRFAESVE